MESNEDDLFEEELNVNLNVLPDSVPSLSIELQQREVRQLDVGGARCLRRDWGI